MPPSLRPLLAAAGAALLAACAGAHPVTTRLRVTTVADWADPAALRVAAEQAAGVPVRDVAPISPRQHALTLDCADAAACTLARQRLQASPLFVEVADDARQLAPTPPVPSTAR